MSISNTTYQIQATGDGATQTFSFPFKIFSATQLQVIQTTPAGVVISSYVLGVDYTVWINPVAEGGAVIWTVAPPVGYVVTLTRQVSYTQSVTLPTEGALPALQISNQLDLMTMMIIQQESNALRIPTSFTGALPAYLPNPVSLNLIGWDVTGTLLVNYVPNTMAYISLPLSIAHGGTGATSAGAALTALLQGNPLSTSQGGTGSTANANAANGVVVLNSSSQLPAVSGALLTSIPAQPYVKVSETQTSGTGGGTASTSSWVTRVLNTKDNDTASIASLGSNQVTLPAGTYLVRVSAPFLNTTHTQMRLYDITHSTSLLLGQSNAVSASVSTGISLTLSGLITLSATSALAVQYQAAASSGTSDLGYASSFGTEVYTVAEFTKIG